MSTQEKDYVSIKPMTSQYSPVNNGFISVTRRSTVLELMDQFHDISKNFYRIDGMAQLPGGSGGLSRCIERILTVLKAVRKCANHYAVAGRNYTFTDCTDFQQLDTKKPYYGIEYVNLIWIGTKAYAYMSICLMQWYTHPSVYSKRVDQSRQQCLIPLDDLSEEVVLGYIALSQPHNGSGLPIDYNTLHAAAYNAVYEIAVSPDEYPVAAAIYIDGTVFEMQRPYRHPHILQTKEYQAFIANSRAEGPDKPVVIQGFVTNFGHFVGRRRALFMAFDKDMVLTDMVMRITRTDAAQFFRHDVEATMHGRLTAADTTFKTYAVAETGLFSEDLW